MFVKSLEPLSDYDSTLSFLDCCSCTGCGNHDESRVNLSIAV